MGGSGQAGYSNRSRLDKLGVKPDARIAVLGLDDAGFLAELRGRTSAVTSGRVPKAADLVFIYIWTGRRTCRASRRRGGRSHRTGRCG